jgi:hypothetical protein
MSETFWLRAAGRTAGKAAAYAVATLCVGVTALTVPMPLPLGALLQVAGVRA